MNCKLEFLFYQTNKAGLYVDPHKHNCYELVYYLKGNGNFSIADTKYNYTGSSFSIIPPNAPHDEKCYSESDLIFIGFSYDNNPITINSGVYMDSKNQAILKLLLNMKEEMLSKNSYYDLKLNYAVSEILIEFDRLNKISKPEINELAYIINFIEENYNKDIYLNTLAEISGYSYHRFRHIFKEKLGLSPTKYIINTRIECSKKLLKETELLISNVALESGFSNSSQFSVLFKRETGLTPYEFRKTV